MLHLPQIIQDLALILIAAGAMTLLFKAIRQPVVLGYIIAGFLVGPNVSWMPTVVDHEGVKVWAEIGVIFLLFALGLEFSFKKLARVGPSASITAIVEIVGMIAVGYAVGQAFGWSAMDSLFLGGILAISSTTIIIRAFDELGMKSRGFVRLVFGVLVVEDLVAILLMVLLTTVAVSQTFSGVQMVASTGKLVFFLTVWFLLGIFLVPTFLKHTRRWMSAETLLVVSLALCFLMVVLASNVGFSPALGAFIMGSILAETTEGNRIEHLIHPVKDLFAAVFFVSVGMLINPEILAAYAWPIAVITGATIFGKLSTTTLGALLSGQSMRHSVQAGMSLAQIGEFSFIIAGLGTSLKVTSDHLYPIAISVSAITTFTTPYMIRSADAAVLHIERNLPLRWANALARFQSVSASVSHTSDWRLYVRSTLMKMLLNGVLVIAIFLLAGHFIGPHLGGPLSMLVAFIVATPFLWALALGRLGGDAESRLWRERRLKTPLMLLQGARLAAALILVAILSSRFVPPGSVGALIGIALLAGIVVLSRYLSKVYLWMESRFVLNLNEKEELEKAKALPALAPWDSHLVELKVSPDSQLVGKKLSEAMVREKYGVTIALIERGSRVVAAPGRNEVLYPGDLLHVIGSDDQIASFRQDCVRDENVSFSRRDLDYALKPIYVSGDVVFANKTIRESGLREALNGLVVGIEKNGQRVLNPDSLTVLEPGDVVWVVADRKRELPK